MLYLSTRFYAVSNPIPTPLTSTNKNVSMAKLTPVWEAIDPDLLVEVGISPELMKKDVIYMARYQTIAIILPILALVKKTYTKRLYAIRVQQNT